MLMAALICGCVQWGGTAVHAEELQEFTLDQYVVTATRTEKKIIDVPASVNVITDKDIKLSGANNVDDVLKRVPGVTVSRTNGFRNSKPVVTMRGVKSGSHVLVLVDGQPMVNAYSGTVNWNDIPIDSIEKVEVVKGPASSIYGSNALAGVISITTKDSKKFHGSASLTYGSNNTWIRKINIGDRVDKFSYDLYYQGTDSDGYSDYVSADIKKNDGTKTVKPASGYDIVSNTTGTGQKAIYGEKGERNWNEDNYSGKFSYKFTDDKSLSVGFLRHKSDYKYDYASSKNWLGTTGNIDVGNNKYFATSASSFAGAPGFVDERVYTLAYKDDENKLNVVAGLTDNRSWNGGKYTDYDYASNFSSYISKRYNFGISKEIELSDKDLAVAGVQYVHDKMDKVRYPAKSGKLKDYIDQISAGKSDTYGIYFQNEHKFNDKLSVIAALRYDRWTVSDGHTYDINGMDDYPESKTESELSPKVALNYKFDDTQSSYVSWGKAFAAPSLYDMFSGTVDGATTKDDYDDNKVTIPNHALSPQLIETIEVGWKKSFDNKTDLEVAVYHNKIKDIAYKGATGNIRYIDDIPFVEEQQVAGAEGETDGIEIGINHRFDNKLSAFANITFQNPIITKSTNQSEVDKLVRTTPKRLLSFGIDYVDNKFMAQLAGNYYSKKYSNASNSDWVTGVPGAYDPVFVLGLNTIYKFDKTHELQFAVSNLLDKEYYNSSLSPGREMMLTYTYKF